MIEVIKTAIFWVLLVGAAFFVVVPLTFGDDEAIRCGALIGIVMTLIAIALRMPTP